MLAQVSIAGCSQIWTKVWWRSSAGAQLLTSPDALHLETAVNQLFSLVILNLKGHVSGQPLRRS